MKKLHEQWGDRVHFVDILVRQAHPGPEEPAYESFEQKLQDAQRYQECEGIPWDVLIDDLQGTVHQVYGGLSDPAYLIDAEGRVAHYTMWTHVPTLYQAIDMLLEQGGRGIVGNGWHRMPHLLPAMADGWRGLKRGLPQSFNDLMIAAPGVPVLLWAGYQLKPILAPLALREKPLPINTRVTLAAGLGMVLALAAWNALGRHGSQGDPDATGP